MYVWFQQCKGDLLGNGLSDVRVIGAVAQEILQRMVVVVGLRVDQ